MLRFWKVSFQTVGAPVLTATLYLLIFAPRLEDRVKVYDTISYTMMSILQNSFANSSSSLIQSKISGNVVFILLPPLSHVEIFAAYVLASVVRGLVVGAGVLAVTLVFSWPAWTSIAWILLFGLLGSAVMGTLGLIAGIWAEKFDQVAAFQNFVIMPLTFLSGVFYSVHSLPPLWHRISQLNPFFYMIDGFRFGFFGASDVNPLISLAVVGTTFIVIAVIALRLLASGYKLRN